MDGPRLTVSDADVALLIVGDRYSLTGSGDAALSGVDGLTAAMPSRRAERRR